MIVQLKGETGKMVYVPWNKFYIKGKKVLIFTNTVVHCFDILKSKEKERKRFGHGLVFVSQ